MKRNLKKPNKIRTEALCKAFMLLKTTEECRRFLLDLCTHDELKKLEDRWHVARLLNETNLSYRALQRETGMCVTTIGSIAQKIVQSENQGYACLLERTGKKKQNTPQNI